MRPNNATVHRLVSRECGAEVCLQQTSVRCGKATVCTRTLHGVGPSECTVLDLALHPPPGPYRWYCWCFLTQIGPELGRSFRLTPEVRSGMGMGHDTANETNERVCDGLISVP